jgi:hypothetical protein
MKCQQIRKWIDNPKSKVILLIIFIIILLIVVVVALVKTIDSQENI